MPRCPRCGDSVSSSVLRAVGDVVVCLECGRPEKVEDRMGNNKKQLASVVLHEISMPDDTIDHEISVEGGYGGLDVKFSATFDQIRAFFTQKRKKQELRAVDEE